MQKISVLLTCLLLSACAEFPGVYRIDIEQGNIVTQDMVDQLRPGMTKRQVRFIMGTPLIEDTFNPERWDYLYSFQPGGEPRELTRMVVFFNEEDRLTSFSGDFETQAEADNL